MHTDAAAIPQLANNTQGGVYDGVPNTNSYGYTVYVDIDGAKVIPNCGQMYILSTLHFQERLFLHTIAMLILIEAAVIV